MTRERKMLAVILGIGLLTLLIDRVFLAGGEPDSAEAALPIALSAATDERPVNRSRSAGTRQGRDADTMGVVEPLAERSPTDGPSMSIAARLATAAERLNLDPGAVDDAFEPPVAWLPQAEGADGDAPTPVSAQGRLFAQDHRLEAVMLNGERSFILVDGKTLRPGDALDGLHLKEIHARAAVFEAGDVRVVLRIRQTPGTP